MAYPIGIDLGTTNSVVCVWCRGRLETIPVDGRATLPSAVSVRSDGNILVGQAAKARSLIEPNQSVISAKRYIGDGTTNWKIEDRIYTPIDVDALILGRLKDSASAYLNQPVTEVVITVPAYFNNNQKRDTKLAAEAAGFQVLQLLPEPTAAAISYGLERGKDQTILVYDLGGGTFDVSVLTVEGNRFSVVAVDGDFHLGGDDFDLVLAEYLVDLLQKQTQENLSLLRELLKQPERMDAPRKFLVARARLKEAAEAAKIELALSDTTQVTIPDILGTLLDEEITIETYNRLIEPLVERTIAKIRDVLDAANLTEEDIDRVILVGGSIRNRLVKKRVTEAVKEPFIAERVDEVVGQGAAIVASYLSSPEEDLTPIEFYNVTPFSLGVCAFDGKEESKYINSIIIQKNNPVPCIELRPYKLSTVPNQNNLLEVYMLQGESRNPIECLMVGKYVFSNVTHVKQGKAVIDIEYGYDQNGIITVQAREKSTNKMLPLTIEEIGNDESWLEQLKTSTFDPSSLKLVVTPAGFDDIGQVLLSMNLPFQNYYKREQLIDCDIFFLNCGTDNYPEAKVLRNYVQQGGCLYASDLTSSIVQEAFPGKFYFGGDIGQTGSVKAQVLDRDLKQALGRNIQITFDMGGWSVLNSVTQDGEAILRSTATNQPLMVMIPIGQGKVFYTCFHNHAQKSKAEEKLLQFLVLKQVSVVSGIPIEVIKNTLK